MRIADIVLVEDTHDDVAIALRIFERHLPGYRVHVLQDGAEALRWVRELDRRGISEQPKVIFLDLSLPGADGFRILEELRSRPTTRHTPVIVLSSSARESEVARSYVLGANSFITKRYGEQRPGLYLLEAARYWLSLNRVARVSTPRGSNSN